MKKIIVLGTGNAQRDILEYLKENGFYVIATSNASGSPAEKLADEFCKIDIVDANAIEQLAKEKEADYIYSVGSDVAMPTVAKASHDLNLPCLIDYETATVCNHKYMLRELLDKKNVIGNIKFQIIEDKDEEITVPFPAIMKPSDSQGQRGVRRVESAEEVKEHFEETVGFSREKKVIVESFIDGDEISVNVFVENGELKFYLISDRDTWKGFPGGLIKEHFIPSKYEEDEAISKKIRKLVVSVLDAIGLKNGPGYFQIKVSTKGEPYLIEVTPRLDGCHMWRVIRYSTGIDLLKASMNLLEGKSYSQSETFEIKPYSLEFMCAAPGTEFHKGDFEEKENEFLRWYYEDGQTVKSMNGYFEKCGYRIKRGN